MIDGTLYLMSQRGKPGIEVAESDYLGAIVSTVRLSEWPTENGQANFGVEGAPYTEHGNGIVVLIGGEWTLFLTEQDRLLEVAAEGSSGQAGTAAGDVKTQMAGNWRWEESNPDNAFLMNLFANGLWESPGPLPTDITVGGSFDIAREESGIYYLRFTVEFQCDTPSSTVFEIGSEFADHLYYRYDARNDRLGMALPLEGGDGVVWYIREQ